MVMIICASRRTDIPAFHSEWLLNRLRAGYAMVRNPVENSVVYRVDLRRESVDALVFITKDPRPMESKLREIGSMGHMYLFQVTLTPYGKDIEPGVPFKADINDSCIRISDRIGRDRMAWRYDPVIFNDRLGAEYHARKFSMMCSEASQWTDRCIFSFVDMYGKLSRFREDGTVRSVTASERARFTEMALDAARENGMVLTSCCTDVPGVERRGCLDRTTMRSLGIPYDTRTTPLREGCLCVRNIDIGEYGTCGHGCIYCYADRPSERSRFSRLYDPEAEMLWGKVAEGDTVVELSDSGRSMLDLEYHS